jgi:hypothetical protein
LTLKTPLLTVTDTEEVAVVGQSLLPLPSVGLSQMEKAM